MKRRAFVTALLASGPAAALAMHARANPGLVVNVRDFGARGNGVVSDTRAFQRAIDAGPPVWVPPGRYLVGNLLLRTGLTLFGEGKQSVLLQGPGNRYLASVNPGAGGFADPERNAHSIALRGLLLDGQVVQTGFAEHSHVVNINACSRLLIEDCEIRGFRGDGVYLGSGNTGRDERHNQDVIIRRCVFDGVNHSNRNAISVIDCQGLLIEECRFTSCSRDDMPGAIDLEPDDHDFHVLRDISIRNNRFVDIGGNLGAISLYLPHKRYANPVRQVSIEGNRILGNGKSDGISLVSRGDCTAQTPDMSIEVARNWIMNMRTPFHIDGAHGVTFTGNKVHGARREGVIGLPRVGRSGRVVVSINEFEDLGTESSRGLRVMAGGPVHIVENRFRRWGSNSSSAALDLSAASPELVTLRRNAFNHGGGMGRVAIVAVPDIEWGDANTFSDGLVPARIAG